MNKPSASMLIFLAAMGVITGVASVLIANQGGVSTYRSLAASFVAGAAVVLCLYVYAPHRWRAVAGFQHQEAAASLAPLSTARIGRASAAGAVFGPFALAIFSLASGWSKAAIIGSISAALSGFLVALVTLWCVLRQTAKGR